MQLLGAGRGRKIFEILIDLVDGSLHVGIDGGIDLIAAGHDHLIDTVVFIAGLVAEVADHVADDLILKPGVIIVTRVVLLTAVVGEDQLLGYGFVILLLIDIALLEHLAQDDLLPLLVFAGVLGADIGVVPGRVVRDADERRALGQTQILDVLAEIDARGRLHALAVFAERNDIEIPLHDVLFGVRFFKLQRAVDLNQLAADRDLPLAGQVLDELLGDGGAAGLALAEEHLEAGAQRCDPVDALMLFKALVLDGDAGVDQVLGDIVILDPRAVGAAVERLQNLVFAGRGILIINDRGLVEREAVRRPFGLLGQIVFYIDRKQAGKDQSRQKRREKHGADHLADGAEHARGAGSFCSFVSFLFRHMDPPYIMTVTGKRRIAPSYIVLSE